MSIIDLSEEPEHLETLASWHHAEWASINPGQTLQDRIDKMQNYLKDDFVPSTFIYKHNGELAGSAAIVENDMSTHKELSPWMASVFVEPSFRKRGIGSALVRHVMQQAKEQGISTLYLFTPDQAPLYESLGWSTLFEEDYHGERVTVMQVALG